jgi:hypothetical protein
MKNFGKQLAVLGILLFGLVMLTFIGCSTGSNPTTEWTVKFDLDGGKFDGKETIANVKVTKGSSLDDQYPANPTKEGGWDFGGWFDSEASDEKYEADTPINKDITLKAKWNNTDPDKLEIKITITGNTGGDSVTVAPEFGKVGEEVTISYTLSGGSTYNQLNFSGITSVSIDMVTTAGTSTIKYVIADEDATDGVITINAMFTHSNKQIVTMVFENEGNQTVTYGDEPFSNAISELTGINYTSSDEDVATVDENGTVTILKVGSTTITAKKAEDDKAYTPAVYELTVEPLQLTIGSPTITSKVYDGDVTADVTLGALSGVVSGDTVDVTAVGTYASANAGTGINVTVVYTIDGADADNYFAPEEETVTGSISKAAGSAVSIPSVASKKQTSITINAVVLQPSNNGQTAEYTISSTISTVAGLTGSEEWQNELTFNELTASTDYYVFARSEAITNYDAGTAQVSAKITTNGPPLLKYDFAANDTIKAGYPVYDGVQAPSNTYGGTFKTSAATGGNFQGKRILEITRVGNSGTPNAPKFTLPFSTGDKTLGDYYGIVLVARGVSGGDLGNKTMIAHVGGTTVLGQSANNAFNLNTTATSNGSVIVIPFSLATANTYSGDVEIGLMISQFNNVVYEIVSIALIPAGVGYDFAAGDTIKAGYPIYDGVQAPSNTYGGTFKTSAATGGNFQGKRILEITRGGSGGTPNTPKFTLPFNTGGKTLADCYGIILVARGVSGGDLGNKTMIAHVGGTTVLGQSANNAFSLNTTTTSNGSIITIPITLSTANTYSGDVDIGFMINQFNNSVYEVASVILLF